jgi:hypothetical protein
MKQTPPFRQSLADADHNAVAPAHSPTAKLSVRQAAAHLGVSKSWLDKRRLDGMGCPYIKIGRRVCYDLADLELFAASLKRRHTSESS